MLKISVVREVAMVLLALVVIGVVADVPLAKMLLPLVHLFSSIATALMVVFMLLVCSIPVARSCYCEHLSKWSEMRRVRWALVDLSAFVIFCAAGWWWLVLGSAAVILMSELVTKPYETYGVALHG